MHSAATETSFPELSMEVTTVSILKGTNPDKFLPYYFATLWLPRLPSSKLVFYSYLADG
jgi:hypothetical protein